MLSTFLVVRLIYQSLVCNAHAQAVAFDCPTSCTCEESRIISCDIQSIMEYPEVGKTAPVGKLSVSSCSESDFNSLTTDTKGYHQVSQMTCDTLTLQDGTKYSNCTYISTNTPTQSCIYLCSNADMGLVAKKIHTRWQTRKCICYTCDSTVEHHRSVLHLRVRRENDIIKTTINTNTSNMTTPRKVVLAHVVAVGGLSIIAFLINFIVMVKLCCSPVTVIDMFATALFFFNVIFSLYGMSMAFYLFRPYLEKSTWYCQFFTSIKLFSFGAALYTMVFLIFHRPIRRSGGDERRDEEEGKKKAAKRDAIFKGIVFLLEAVMLAGVLSVLAWIKKKNWKTACVVITPMDSVDGLLHGIEIWYYALSGILVSWYFGNLVYRQYKIIKAWRDRLKAIEAGDEEEDVHGDESDTPEIAPYIIRDFPIFILIALSFSIWLAGYIVTQPSYNAFAPDAAAVLRLCSLIIPIIIQPFIYIIRETFLCTLPCLKSGKHRTNTVEEIKLNKSQSDESQEASNNNLEVVTTQFDNAASPLPIARVEHSEQSDQSDAEKQPPKKKTKTRSANDFEVPKVVCRSPNLSDERTRLLDDTDGDKKPPTPTIIVGGLDVVTENTGLINGEGDVDDNGRVSRGPTFYPIADKETGGKPKQVELKSYTPIKEKKAEEEKAAEESKQISNNGKEKRKEKKVGKNVNSTDSTASLEWDAYSHSDSSSSHEEPLHEINTKTTPVTDKPDWDPNKFEGKTSPTTELTKLKNEINKPNPNNKPNINNNNNDIDRDQLISNNSDPVSGATSVIKDNSTTYDPNHDALPKMASRSSNDVKAESNHTGKRLKKPVLTRDNSGSVER